MTDPALKRAPTGRAVILLKTQMTSAPEKAS
jgi:hypothetical protein